MEDLDIGPVMRWLDKGVRLAGPKFAASSPATWHYWLQWESLKLIDGVLFCRFSQEGWYRGAYPAHCPKEAEG